MKVVQINSVCEIGSTGRIVVEISKLLDERSVENIIFYTSGQSKYKNAKKYSDEVYIKAQALRSRVLGNYGFNSKRATHRLLMELDRFKPDIVHIHNIHGHDCDLERLFTYLKEKKIKVVWTFHDCWAFTGYCAYFDMVNCDGWKKSCGNCPQKKTFTWIFDRSKFNLERKKELFSGLDLTIVTPSKWLADRVKQSFLQGKEVLVINNGVDLKIFRPTESDFRERFNCKDKFVLLGVSFEWSTRKGFDVFLELAKRLDDRFQIVLVGTNDAVDRILPSNVISIHRTQNQKELAEIYSAADLFVNPTREEVLGMVNVEAVACGTPVITFDTGGSPECIDGSCGCVVEKNNIDELHKKIEAICTRKTYSVRACTDRATKFEANAKFSEYISLYLKIETEKQRCE